MREFCAENLTGVREAIAAGAQRIELCDDLAVGGVSPTDEVIAEASATIHELGARVMVMARPRGGDFAYDEGELCAMERVIAVARAAGAEGVVFGCARDGHLDEGATERLAHAAEGLDLTFHMAFDEIMPEEQPAALHALADLGFSRVLTHGGPLTKPIASCLPHLRELIAAAEGRIVVMPGGGVTWENADEICELLGVSEVHGTRIVNFARA